MWAEAGTGGTSPGCRVGHSLTVLGDRAILYGGSDDGDVSGDAFGLSLSQMKWTRPKLHGAMATPRWKHTACGMRDRDAVFIVGGLSENFEELMDCQLLDVSGSSGPWHWCRVVTYGEAPCPRAHHTTTNLDGSRILVFGGYGTPPKQAVKRKLNDVHEATLGCAAAAWDTQCKPCDDVCEAVSVTWTQPAVNGAAPTARCGHAAAFINNKLIIIGGEDESGYLLDCFVLDTESWTWSEAESAPSPARRNHLAMWTPALKDSISMQQPHLIVFSGQTKAQQDPKAGSRLVADCNMCKEDFEWSSLHIESSPSPREGSAWILDTKSSRAPRLLLFGGQGGVSGDHCLGDVHELDLLKLDCKPLPIIDAVGPDEVEVCGGGCVTLSGRYLEGEDIVVRVSDEFGHQIQSRGTLIDAAIEFMSPAWPVAEGGAVEVQVSIDAGPWSACVPWRYIPVPPAPAPEPANQPIPAEAEPPEEDVIPPAAAQAEEVAMASEAVQRESAPAAKPESPAEQQRHAGAAAAEEEANQAQEEEEAEEAAVVVEEKEEKKEEDEEEKAAAAEEEEEAEEELSQPPTAGSMAAPEPHPGLDQAEEEEEEEEELMERRASGVGAAEVVSSRPARVREAKPAVEPALPPVDPKYAPIGQRNSFRKVGGQQGIPFSYQVRRTTKADDPASSTDGK